MVPSYLASIKRCITTTAVVMIGIIGTRDLTKEQWLSLYSDHFEVSLEQRIYSTHHCPYTVLLSCLRVILASPGWNKRDWYTWSRRWISDTLNLEFNEVWARLVTSPFNRHLSVMVEEGQPLQLPRDPNRLRRFRLLLARHCRHVT